MVYFFADMWHCYGVMRGLRMVARGGIWKNIVRVGHKN